MGLGYDDHGEYDGGAAQSRPSLQWLRARGVHHLLLAHRLCRPSRSRKCVEHHHELLYYEPGNDHDLLRRGRDGWTRSSTGADTWSNKYTNTNGYANYTDAVAYSGVTRGDTTNQYYQIARGIIQFDTSAIPDDATIVSARVYLQGNKYTGNSPTFDSNFNLSTTTPSSNTTLTSSDYNISKHGSTILSTSIPYASWSTSTYNQYPLNAAGLAAINKTGHTALSLRALIDIENNPPASPGGPENSYYTLEMYTSETSGTSQDPYIEVTYTNRRLNPVGPLLRSKKAPRVRCGGLFLRQQWREPQSSVSYCPNSNQL
jgi:hypothetical protein